MRLSRWLTALLAAGVLIASGRVLAGQDPQSATPTPMPELTPSPTAEPSALPTASPTPPPIVVQPQAASVPVNASQVLRVGGVIGTITATVHDPALLDAVVNQADRTVTLTGKAPGGTIVTIADQRGLTQDVGVRVAYNAGSIADSATLLLTGDPASAEFVRAQAAGLAKRLTQTRPGTQIVASTDDVAFHRNLPQDNVANVDVPVLLQGEQYFTVTGTTHLHVENVAVPRISPDLLMVSDYPERLTENGLLFTADLQRDVPSRFLYFHYNPADQADRRIVLRVQNSSPEPATIQFISGAGGPAKNEMAVGHDATRNFLSHVVQNEGRLIVVPGNGSLNLIEHNLPAGTVVCNLLQLRVLNGASVHLSLFAQNASDDPDQALTSSDLLESLNRHARGIYTVPEFYDMRQWDVTGPYLEIPIGQLPLQNNLKGEALAGDYGVLQSFVVSVQNPRSTPQSIAIYENPRGGRATGTYLIDGVLVQSHQVTAFSNYKIRQYVVPAKGFVRITIVTMPEGGSSYPLRLVFAPDDGSVPPGAPGSPIY